MNLKEIKALLPTDENVIIVLEKDIETELYNGTALEIPSKLNSNIVTRLFAMQYSTHILISTHKKYIVNG